MSEKPEVTAGSIPPQDIFDTVRYQDVAVEENTGRAFKRLFDPGNPDAVLVAKHLVDFCGYGSHIPDPEERPYYMGRASVISELKKFTNSNQTFKIEDEEADEI